MLIVMTAGDMQRHITRWHIGGMVCAVAASGLLHAAPLPYIRPLRRRSWVALGVIEVIALIVWVGPAPTIDLLALGLRVTPHGSYIVHYLFWDCAFFSVRSAAPPPSLGVAL